MINNFSLPNYEGVFLDFLIVKGDLNAQVPHPPVCSIISSLKPPNPATKKDKDKAQLGDS